MSDFLKPGMKVRTQFGPGTIHEVRNSDHVVVSLSGNDVKVRVNRKDLVLVEDTGAERPGQSRIKKPSVPEPVTLDAKEKERFSCHKAIESLRFGLAPEKKADKITAQYENLQNWVLDTLPHKNGHNYNVSEVCGPYGTGKSHTMSIVRHVAQCKGYITAKVEVDGDMVSLGNPEGLLASLWTSLSGKDFYSATPLLDLYVKVIKAGRKPKKIFPNMIDRISANYGIIQDLMRGNHLELHEYVIDAILSSSNEYSATEANNLLNHHLSDQYQFLRRMIGQKVAERPYDFLQSLFGHAKICELAGYKGLVVTIDEFEVQHIGRFWDRVEALLEALTEFLSGNSLKEPIPCALYFATVGQPDHRGDAAVDEMIEACDGNYLELKELTRSDLFKVARKVFDLYNAAYLLNEHYNENLTSNAYQSIEAVGSGKVRNFIKHYIALLDQQHGDRRL